MIQTLEFDTHKLLSSVHAVFAFLRVRIISGGRKLKLIRMADWGPVLVGVILFVLLTPGLLFQFPGNSRTVDFGNFGTSGRSILVHSLIFFGLLALFTVVIDIHVYTG